ncbi:hypothetical protein ACRE21_10250, partial [Streptococcus pneumoniae]
LLSKIGLTTTLKNAWTTSRQVNFFWVANFNLKFGDWLGYHYSLKKVSTVFCLPFHNFYK